METKIKPLRELERVLRKAYCMHRIRSLDLSRVAVVRAVRACNQRFVQVL